MRHRFQRLLLLLPLLSGGCMTSALWNKTELDAWNQPANPSHLKLFDASQRNDYLVVYDEYSERRDGTRVRAYFLNQNEPCVAQGRKPHFVSPKLAREWPPIPVLSQLPLESNQQPSVIYAVIATNQSSFAIFPGGPATKHELPVYNDGWGRTERIALTPVAVVADLTIVGGVVGCLFIYGLAESGYSTGVR